MKSPTKYPTPLARTRQKYDRSAILDRIQLLMDIMRAHANWDQTEFAAKAGLTPPKLSHYLSRRHRPDIDSLASIAERVGISMEWLVFGSGPIWIRDLETGGVGMNESVLAMSSVLHDIANAMAETVVQRPSKGEEDRTGVDQAVAAVLTGRLGSYTLADAGV